MGREEGSGWGTHVYLWWIHYDIWQNQYNIVKFKKKKNSSVRDFPGGPVVKNPPCNAGDAGLIPGGGTKIPHAMEPVSPCMATRVRAPA